jgi:hypothetical protein
MQLSPYDREIHFQVCVQGYVTRLRRCCDSNGLWDSRHTTLLFMYGKALVAQVIVLELRLAISIRATTTRTANPWLTH